MSYRAITSTRISYTSAAGETRTINATGTFFYLTTGSNVEVSVWDSDNRTMIDKVVLVAGRGVKFPPDYPPGFKVAIRSAAAQAIVLDVIDGEIIDNSFIISSASAVTTTPSGTTLATGAVVSALATASTLISAGAANIQRRWVRNADAATTIYIRENNTAAQSAIALAPGAVAVLENQSDLYAYNASGAPVNVYVSTETTT